MTDAYVVGIDMIKFGRFPERTVPDIGAEAALLALQDCGLKIQDMEALYCGNLGQAAAMVGQRVLQEIGQTGIPVVNCSNACATGATAFREGWMAIKAGVYDIVIAAVSPGMKMAAAGEASGSAELVVDQADGILVFAHGSGNDRGDFYRFEAGIEGRGIRGAELRMPSGGSEPSPSFPASNLSFKTHSRLSLSGFGV